MSAIPGLRQLASLTLVLAAFAGACGPGNSVRLEGFQVSRHWDEQTKDLTFEPDVRIHVNAPSRAGFDRRRPTQLIFYALPNGNTIEWTIGRAKAEGLDWHYDIQHIGAQTRRLREVLTDRNIVVAYLEAQPRSWPTWRRQHEDCGERILRLIAYVREQVGAPDVSLVLSGHSGGGSIIFGYLNAVDRVGDDVKRIALLDANYAFSADDGHGVKLLEWLSRSQDHYLNVLAYDDREITFEGKKVVGPTGGTFRATGRMLEAFKGRVDLIETTSGDWVRRRGLDGRIDIIVHLNPRNRILHTALVGDMNGFIHAMTSGTADEGKAGVLGEPACYSQWIQPD